ncbi:MAG: hypothetical protein HC799_17450 [Limnothrix sp. RL_2_0]|nr:hypothetical protein [Limnothrix sp. RL_2_0]
MRSRAELNSLFGRGIVDAAIARRFAVCQWEKSSVQNQTKVIRAIQNLEERIESPPDAVAYCQSLSTDVRDCLIISLL